jgi:hypothetical protein
VPDIHGFQPRELARLADLGLLGDELRNCDPPLTTAVREAFLELKEVPVPRHGTPVLVVGATQWGDKLRTRIETLRQALEKLNANAVDDQFSFAGMLEVLGAVVRHGAKMKETGAQIADTLRELLDDGGPFSRALNELLALFTPARWAYEDLITETDVNRAEAQMEMRTRDKVATRFRLNTAELNTVALAIFLLGARRLGNSNPLRILALDDALQNMDELTVTTIARGLGRLLRLWQQRDGADGGWQLVVLLHGDEDLERLRREVPCAAYFMPWLAPHTPLDREIEIAGEGSLLGTDLHDARSLFAVAANVAAPK